MPWSGTGTYTRIYGASGWTDDKNSGVKILSSRHDTHDQDLADGINACLTRDNQAKPTSSFLPSTDNTINLGSGSFRWAQINGVSFSDLARLSQDSLFTQSDAAGASLRIQNTNTGTAAFSQLASQNSAHALQIILTSTGFTGAFITGGATGESANIYTDTSVPLSLGTNSTERVRIAGDGSLINLQATAVQINGTAIQSTGSGTLTLNGGTTAPTVAYQYFKTGNHVLLRVAAGSFTSNSAAFTLSSLPAAIQPSTAQEFAMPTITDNGVAATTGSLSISGTTITLNKNVGSPTSWTNAGTKGFNTFTISYYV